MLRTDGTFIIYRIQHKGKSGVNRDRWHYSSFDAFGTPPGFSASDTCWQQTGIYGTFSRNVALKGLAWIRKAKRYDWRDYTQVSNADTKFRLVMVQISQRTTPVVSTTGPEATPPRRGRSR